MPVMDKRIFKTFAEITDSVKQNITNKLQHRKCVRRVQQINTYLEVQSKETAQKANLITILCNSMPLGVVLGLLCLK